MAPSMLVTLVLLTAFSDSYPGLASLLTALGAILLCLASPLFARTEQKVGRDSWTRYPLMLVAIVLPMALFSFTTALWTQESGGPAPALLVNARTLRWLAALAFALYVSGLSMTLVQTLVPSLYTFVQTYAANPDYRSGVRIDFAVFSIFWYVLPHMLAPAIREPQREAILQSSAVYLVMVLPFFAVGWGSYSNRFLLPAWLAASLIVAAVLCHSRVSVLRNPLLIQLGLLASCAALHYYVSNGIVV